MPGARAPQEVERALKRLTPEQFSQVCGEVGILEVTLPGATQAARAAALVERTQGHTDFAALIRAINRIDPNAWHIAPARASISSAVYGLIALVAILGIGGLVLVLVLSGSEAATQVTPTPTDTLAPTRTPVPTFTHTPTHTPVPSDTGTPTRTPTPTRQASSVASTRAVPPTPVATPSPVVSIIYPQVELLQPSSDFRASPGETVEFRWILRSSTPIASDERYLMRLYLNTQVGDAYLTPDPWRFYPVPPGANGTFGWTVTVVKVDAAGDVIGALSPESGQRTVVWQP